LLLIESHGPVSKCIKTLCFRVITQKENAREGEGDNMRDIGMPS